MGSATASTIISERSLRNNVNVFGVQLLVSASVDFVDNDGPEHLIRLQDIYYAPEGNHGVVHHHGGQLPFLFIGDPQPSGNGVEGAGFVLRVANEIGWLGMDSGCLRSGCRVFTRALRRVNLPSRYGAIG